MYSISEASKIIGVSRQSIYKKIYKEGLQEHLIEGDKGKVITEESLNLLKELFSEYLDSKPENDNLHTKNSNPADNLQSKLTLDYISDLKEEIQFLKNQLLEKDKQIESLTRLNENSQILLKQQQDLKLLPKSQENKLRGFLSKCFNIKN